MRTLKFLKHLKNQGVRMQLRTQENFKIFGGSIRLYLEVENENPYIERGEYLVNFTLYGVSPTGGKKERPTFDWSDVEIKNLIPYLKRKGIELVKQYFPSQFEKELAKREMIIELNDWQHLPTLFGRCFFFV